MAKQPFGKWVDWVEGPDGISMPVPRYTAPVTVQEVREILPSALALPYEPHKDKDGEYLPGEEKLIGLTNAEVIAYRRVVAAASPTNPDSLYDATFVYDRVMGKPKQTVETTQVQVTYQDMLTKWAEEDKARSADTLAIEARDDEQWNVVVIESTEGDKEKIETIAELNYDV